MNAEALAKFCHELAPVLGQANSVPAIPPITFLSPGEIVAYESPPGSLLVGENHLNKGAISVIAGAPGVGKSRAAMGLAIAGATGADWFGLRIHQRFKTLIIQNENGSMRLKQEMTAIGGEKYNDFIRVTPPPPFGLNFYDGDFVSTVKAFVAEFKPDLIIIDPWTALITDDKGKDYREMLKQLRAIFGSSDSSPAILIVAHTRKPKPGENSARGRGLMHEVAGSYVLTSSARSVFNLVAVTDDPDDDRVIFENSKNNDGKQPKPTAWHRCNGLFAPCEDFDWKAYNKQNTPKGRAAVGIGDLREIFEEAGGILSRLDAAKTLQTRLKCSKAVAYATLESNGKFADYLTDDGKHLRWNEPESE